VGDSGLKNGCFTKNEKRNKRKSKKSGERDAGGGGDDKKEIMSLKWQLKKTL
jgi:hypothetical protein